MNSALQLNTLLQVWLFTTTGLKLITTVSPADHHHKDGEDNVKSER